MNGWLKEERKEAREGRDSRRKGIWEEGGQKNKSDNRTRWKPNKTHSVPNG